MHSSKKQIALFALIGIFGGFFSGLFGVGGGIILVPLLIFVGLNQKLASGTSLLAILPTSIAGTVTYAAAGNINWIAGVCLGGGAVLGSIIGTWLLHRIQIQLLRWLFIAFLIAVAIRMFLFVPARAHELQLDPWLALALIGVGLAVGVLSGLFGIGGGVVVVPTLMLLFGFGDLIAKGTSLLMMIPTSLTGTLNNLRSGNVDLLGGLIVGGLAVLGSVLGAGVAGILDPKLGAILFALLVVYSAGQLMWNLLRDRHRGSR